MGDSGTTTVTTPPKYEVSKTNGKGKGDAVAMEADGTFYLRAGESVVFDVQDSSVSYYVQETGIKGEGIAPLNDLYNVLLNGQVRSGYKTDTAQVARQSRVLVENRYKAPHSLVLKKEVEGYNSAEHL